MDRNDHSLDFEAAKAGQTTDEKRKKAAELYAGLEKARSEMKAYREIKDLLNVFLAEGSEVVHFSFGRGVVILLDRNMLEVNFGGDDDRKFSIESVISKGVITVPDERLAKLVEMELANLSIRQFKSIVKSKY